MRFSCNQQVLSKALNTVSKAVTQRTTIPILKGILIQAKSDGKLILSASDLDLSIEKTILNVNVEEEGSTVVLSKLFFDIIRKLPNTDITIQQDDQNIIVKAAGSEFTIIGLLPDEFPNIGEIDDADKLMINKEIFKNMIRRSAFSASIDESKGIITGVLIELEENNIRMVALDGFRMAVITEEMKNEKNSKIIISARILSDIYKIISELDEEEMSFVMNNKKAVIVLENTKIVLRLLDGEFIKYKDILPKESKCVIKVSRNAMFESIERASLLSKEGKNNLVKIVSEEKLLIITSRSDEGNVREEIEADRTGDDIEIGFNSKYLLDVLKVLEEEEVLLEMNTSIKPCVIKPVTGDNFKYLVLPVRISSN